MSKPRMKAFFKKIIHYQISKKNKYLKSHRNFYLSYDDFLTNLDSLKGIDLKKASQIVFVNNAATIDPICQFSELGFESLNNAMEVNLYTPLRIIKKILSLKIISANILLVNVTTGASEVPIKGWLSYSTSKNAFKTALKTIEYENTNIESLNFDPGVVDTNMQKKIRQQTKFNMPDVKRFRLKTKDTSCRSNELN